MRFLKHVVTSRRQRRHVAVAISVVVVALAFSASFVAAQESRIFLQWFNQANGGGWSSNDNTTVRITFGQAAVGRTSSDDFDLKLGYYNGVQAGASAFAGRVQELALTPLPTATPTLPPTITPVPTEVPLEETATASAVEDTPTPEAPIIEATPEPTHASTPTLASTSVPSTQALAVVTPSAELPTNTPIVIVVTTAPEPETEPAATATPYIIVVTTAPEPETEPAATATPYIIVVTAPPTPSSGGACGVPANPGSGPLDLGMLMLLVAPFMLWRFGIKP